MTDVKSAYAGEAQLIRWGDGPQGHTVTLRLSSDPTAINPFKGLPLGDNGQRMEIVCVLKDDHEEPIDPDKAKANSRRRKAPTKPDNGRVAQLDEHRSSIPTDAGSSPVAPTKREYTRSQVAAMKLNDSDFQNWIIPGGVVEVIENDVCRDWPATADKYLKAKLGISSKRELDLPGPKADAFDKLITTFDNRQYLR